MTGYAEFEFSAHGIRKRVYVKGRGPGILLMHELPGMVPACVRLADYLVDRGFTVFVPLLFGQANARESSLRTLLHLAEICIRREIYALAADRDSPITPWLRGLTHEIRLRCPEGRGIGVIGMCLTGGFVINVMIEDVVLAPVACQPSLPVVALGGSREALGVSPATLAAAVARASHAPLLCYRFDGDTVSPPERFARLEREFRPSFEGHTLPGDGHSTLTLDFVDHPNHPTYQQRERIVSFFVDRLA